MDNVELVDNILQAFNEDPTTSARRVAAQLNVSYKVVWKVLKAHGRHPYHHTRVQGLEPGDPPSKASILSMDDRTGVAFRRPDFVDGRSHVHPCRSVQSTQRTRAVNANLAIAALRSLTLISDIALTYPISASVSAPR